MLFFCRKKFLAKQTDHGIIALVFSSNKLPKHLYIIRNTSFINIPENMFQSIGDVLQMIASRDWETFRSAVLSRPALFRHIASAVSSCSELNGMTLLHAVVRYNPPLDVVAQMIRLCPDMPAAKDCLGRTPLHVAAGSKASASILKLLAHACPAACDVLDAEGKAPLHIVCDSSSVLFKEDRNNENSDTPSQPPNHDAVETLLSYSLHVVTLEDDEDMSPLEHAIMSNASLKTVRMLQSATRKRKQLNDGLRSFIISAKALQVSILSSHASVPSAKKKIRTISVED